MNYKKPILCIFAFIIFFEAIFLFSIPPVRANGTIPEQYSQKLELNNLYVYNVSQFDSILNWVKVDYSSQKGIAYTNPGGQIIVNFTGFYDKEPIDMFNCMDNPIPYLDIKFLENQSNILVANLTLTNISNSEAAMNLAISYSNFKSGFLIPNDNFTKLSEKAYAQDIGGMAADIKVEETYNYIYFDFKQNLKYQNSSMLYEKKTGLLIWAKVQSFFGPDLEISLNNYSIEFEDPLLYNVSQFDSILQWYTVDYMLQKGIAYTNFGGLIIVNVTGFYDKEAIDTYNCFDNPIAYLNVSFFENRSNALIANLTLYNISNSEAAMNLAISYSNFRSGFIVPIDNLSKLKENAYAQNVGSYSASISAVETDLTIMLIFKQNNRAQNSTMIYEKRTGILLWSKVENKYGPDLEIMINGYVPWSLPENPPSPPNEGDDDDFDELKKKESEESKTLTQIITVVSIVFVIVVIVISIVLLKRKK